MGEAWGMVAGEVREGKVFYREWSNLGVEVTFSSVEMRNTKLEIRVLRARRSVRDIRTMDELAANRFQLTVHSRELKVESKDGRRISAAWMSAPVQNGESSTGINKTKDPPCKTKPARMGHPGKGQSQNRFDALRIVHPPVD